MILEETFSFNNTESFLFDYLSNSEGTPFSYSKKRFKKICFEAFKFWRKKVNFEGTFFEGATLSRSPKTTKNDKSIDFHQRSIAPKKFIYSLENFIYIKILLFFLCSFFIKTVFSVTFSVQVFSLSFFLSVSLSFPLYKK